MAIGPAWVAGPLRREYIGPTRSPLAPEPTTKGGIPMLRNTTWFVLALLVSARAGAQPPTPGASAPKSRASQRSALDIPRLARVLESGSEAEIIAALEEIAGHGRDGGPAAPLVHAPLLRCGRAPRTIASFDPAQATR